MTDRDRPDIQNTISAQLWGWGGDNGKWKNSQNLLENSYKVESTAKKKKIAQKNKYKQQKMNILRVEQNDRTE